MYTVFQKFLGHLACDQHSVLAVFIYVSQAPGAFDAFVSVKAIASGIV